MLVSAHFELSPPDRKFRTSAGSGSILHPEVDSWYIIDHGGPSWGYLYHGPLIVDHVGLSKSSDWEVEHFTQGEINPPAGSSDLAPGAGKRSLM